MKKCTNEREREREREREGGGERERERDAGKIVRGTKTNAKNAHTRSIDWLETETNIKKEQPVSLPVMNQTPLSTWASIFAGSVHASQNAMHSSTAKNAQQHRASQSRKLPHNEKTQTRRKQ